MAKVYEYLEEDETEPDLDLEDSSDIYSNLILENLRENDESSDEEDGFMSGYNGA
jgi:hypothetical protein